jgi:ssDNA-specific exonuclease RecJ
MVVENTQINALKEQANLKIQQLLNKIEKLEKADKILTAIQFRGREDGDNTIFDVPPKDQLDDSEISETKRQAIFDKITTRIAAI